MRKRFFLKLVDYILSRLLMINEEVTIFMRTLYFLQHKISAHIQSQNVCASYLVNLILSPSFDEEYQHLKIQVK